MKKIMFIILAMSVAFSYEVIFKTNKENLKFSAKDFSVSKYINDNNSATNSLFFSIDGNEGAVFEFVRRHQNDINVSVKMRNDQSLQASSARLISSFLLNNSKEYQVASISLEAEDIFISVAKNLVDTCPLNDVLFIAGSKMLKTKIKDLSITNLGSNLAVKYLNLNDTNLSEEIDFAKVHKNFDIEIDMLKRTVKKDGGFADGCGYLGDEKVSVDLLKSTCNCIKNSEKNYLVKLKLYGAKMNGYSISPLSYDISINYKTDEIGQ